MAHAHLSLATSALPVGHDELIRLIYAGPLETTPWHGFLGALAGVLGCRNAGLVLRLSREGTPPIAIWGRSPGIGDAEARRLQSVHAAMGHLDPLRNVLDRPGAIRSLDEVMTREELTANRFYQEILAPYGFERMLGMYVREPGGWECNVGVVNGVDEADFGDDARNLLRELAPHIEQSLAIFARLRREETEVQALIETLDRLTIATFILGADGRILRRNDAGRRLTATRDIIGERDGRLQLVDRAANAELQEIVASIPSERSAGRGAPPFVQALRVETVGERHCGLLVRSIDSSAVQGGNTIPAAVVYVSTGRTTQPLERLVTQLFDLTPSEAHLATLLATGFSLADAATKLGLTENTVRTYCKTILNKVGVSRQADLVALILRSVAVLG